MTSPRPSAFSRFCAAFVAAALVLQPLGAYAATTVLAESPLQGVNPVKPNIMFTLDDSASMDDEYLPDYVGEGCTGSPTAETPPIAAVSDFHRSRACPPPTYGRDSLRIRRS